MKLLIALSFFLSFPFVLSVIPAEDTYYANNCLGCLTANSTYTYCAGTTKKCYQGLSSACTSTMSDFVSSCGTD